MPSGEQREVTSSQHGDVFRPVLQRQRADRHHVEPVEEILTKPSGAHLAAEIAIRGGHHANIDRDLFVASHRHHGPLLQHPEQLGLEFQFHLPDLVEKDRAAIGRAEAAERGRGGAGERSLHVPEHVAGEERARRDRTVDGNERLRGPIATAVDRAGDQFLAGAARAQDEHAGLVRGDEFDRLANLLSPWRDAGDLFDAVARRGAFLGGSHARRPSAMPTSKTEKAPRTGSAGPPREAPIISPGRCRRQRSPPLYAGFSGRDDPGKNFGPAGRPAGKDGPRLEDDHS